MRIDLVSPAELVVDVRTLLGRLSLLTLGRQSQSLCLRQTVSVHVSNIMAKLGASGRTEAVALARRGGVLID
jgi:hypothetical protein